MWLRRARREVPRQATSILAARGRRDGPDRHAVVAPTPRCPTSDIEVEQIRADVADRVARSLAPVRDASTASLATSIPRTAPLLDVLGAGMPTAAWISDAVALAEPAYGARRSRSASAPTASSSLDLVADGPHALIGGTSGPGKSELLQSMVAALAVRHPPTRLNFLFVDYKGGASSTVFTDAAPHRRLRHQPRRRAGAAGPDVAAGRAQPPHARDGGPGQGPRRDAGQVPRRRAAVAGDRGRRVRHAGQGDPRLRRRHRRHRPARPQPRHPPRAGDAAPVRRR